MSMIRHKSPRLRLENHIVTQKEEEIPKGGNMVEEIIFLEEEEEAEEERKGVIHVERQDTCLGNVPRKRKEEAKFTFQK